METKKMPKQLKNKSVLSDAKKEEPSKLAMTESKLLQQMLLEKEKEIVSLQKNIDKLEFKMMNKEKENNELKGSINSSSNESELKMNYHNANMQLKQQVQLNRMQALQLLELEQALWQAEKGHEEAEEKL